MTHIRNRAGNIYFYEMCFFLNKSQYSKRTKLDIKVKSVLNAVLKDA